MYLSKGFQVDGLIKIDSKTKCILKLNKSLHSLNKALFNWCKKLKTGLMDRGFTSSKIDPCIYLKYEMMILT